MAITGLAKPTVIEAVAEMRWLGFLWRTAQSQGTNSGLADSYQLCLPKDMTHVPMIDAKTAEVPAFHEMPPIAQQTAIALEVDKRLRKASGYPGQPGGKPGQPLVVVSDNLQWWSQLTPPTHLTHSRSTHGDHHSNSAESAPRTSSQRREYDFADSDDCCDYVLDHLGDDLLNPGEDATIFGMLSRGAHPKEVLNTILSMRGEGEAA